MEVISVNVSLPRIETIDDKEVLTSIFKQPVDGPVMLRSLDFDGDAQGDLDAHGGPDRAAYAYPWEHYAHWSRELGLPQWGPGQFGENLTIAGLSEDEVRIGDEFAIGEAVVMVSQPRTPCFKLAHKMGLPEFPKQFLASGRIGFYLRVAREGVIKAGDPVERVATDPEAFTVRGLSYLRYFDRGNVDGFRRAAEIPALSEGWRQAFAEMARSAARG
ncbi:MAG: MOSC domain-containing protein [Chloroflexota bacterium]|nr:MOSC domain-containing protein [Chloroflexota bacterium]MDE2969414.1 MOSC domain-containing protein [Chloroflexota bacterium]